jgi:hypothetical protein
MKRTPQGDLCCGSGMLIPNPNFYLSRIPDQTTTKEKGEKIVSYFFVGTNFTKLKIILFLTGREKNLCQLTKN